jgi:CRISPR system Cascade subunit CasE
MLRLNVHARAVLEHARHAGLCSDAPEWVDWGYLLHVYLTDLFGTKAPRPFHVDTRNITHGIPSRVPRACGDEREDRLCVLGYVTEDPETLRADAQQFANPVVWSGVDWTSKPMPTRFESGQRFGFSVRVCPVKRRHDKGPAIEVDAFRRDRWLDRGTAYHDWIRNRIGGATVLRSDLQGFRLDPLLRRTQAETVADRQKRKLFRPDAVLEGLLQVTDPDRFRATLIQGVGRHRGFGFGMVLLRRPA